jgi:hypothetical protein
MDSIPTAMKVTLRDHRQLAKEELEGQLQDSLAQCPTPALLWIAQRPKKHWFRGVTEHRPLVLASSERFEQILWLSPQTDVQVPEEWRLECQHLLRDYPQLYKEGDLDTYAALVRGHISRQEKELFPELLRYLPDADRALRELGYEHRGLEAGLDRMPKILQAHRSGELAPPDRERFDLDFYHLLEHNLERKLDAVYPALIHLRE